MSDNEKMSAPLRANVPDAAKQAQYRKAITDAPNLRDRYARACAACQFATPIPVNEDPNALNVSFARICSKFEFETRQDWVCDAFELKPPETDAQTVGEAVIEALSESIEGKTVAGDRQDSVIVFGDSIKAIRQDGHLVTVGGYLIRFGDETKTDTSGDFFTKATDYGLGVNTKAHTWFHHTLPIQVKGRDGKVKLLRITREFAPAELELDDIGIFACSVLDERDEYERMVVGLVRADKCGWSSGTAPHLVKRTQMPNGAWRIDRWIVGDDASYTHTPAEYRNRISALKSLPPIVLDEPEATAEDEAIRFVAGAAKTAQAADDLQPAPKSKSEVIEMDEQELMALLDKRDALKAAQAQAQMRADEERTRIEAARLEDLQKQVDERVALALKGVIVPAGVQTGVKTAAPAHNKTPRGDDAFKAFTWFLKTGDAGGIRTGEAHERFMKTDYHLLEGTQYQGQEAVPTEVYAGIVQKRDPLSIMRAAKAQVINAKSNAIVVPVEKASPQAWGITSVDGSNTFTTLTQQPIDKLAATLYMFTYNLPYDIQLIDDATFDIEGWGSQYVGRGLAITENAYLLMGTGSSQPQGAVYAGTTGVTAASAAAVTAAELVQLFYKLPTEYQDNVVWAMATATHGAVRGLSGNPFYFVGNGGQNGGAGKGGFPQGSGWLVDERSRVFTSGAMDALAASKKPISVMNAEAGYAIIDRKVLTVLRDPYSEASKGIVNVWFYARFSGGVTNATAIQNLVTPSA